MTMIKMPVSAKRELAALLDEHNEAAVVSMWNPQTIAAWKARHRGQFNLSERTSQWRGVRFVQGKGWQARLRRGGRYWHLGYCQDERDAALLYNFAAYRVFGDNYQPNEGSDE